MSGLISTVSTLSSNIFEHLRTSANIFEHRQASPSVFKRQKNTANQIGRSIGQERLRGTERWTDLMQTDGVTIGLSMCITMCVPTKRRSGVAPLSLIGGFFVSLQLLMAALVDCVCVCYYIITFRSLCNWEATLWPANALWPMRESTKPNK